MTPAELDAWLFDPRRTPIVMGVLNVTPDSFSDGGRHRDPVAASERARAMLAQGADWVDVGGESTRPGSESVPPDEQLRRVLPAIRAAADLGVVVSIDTADASVAAAALDAGATVVNDVTAGRDPLMFDAMKRAKAAVLMHMKGTPRTMQQSPAYDDVTAEVAAYLKDRADASGLDPRRVVLDPGIGFGKTTAHNLTLLRDTSRFAALGHPLLVGASRKRFVGEITGEDRADRRQFGTAATVAWCVAAGASVLRVHDVRAMRQVVDMTRAIIAAPPTP